MIRESRYQRELSELATSDSRLEEAAEGLEIVLGRLAEHGMAVRGTGLDSWPLHTPGGKRYRVYCDHSPTEVHLISIFRLVLPPEDRFEEP